MGLLMVLITTVFMFLCIFPYNLALLLSKQLRNSSNRSASTALKLDIFGLGPTEVVVIITAGVLLFGPDKLKSQLKEKGIKGGLVSSGWRAESLERIDERRSYATKRRNQRSWDRINEAIEQGDDEMARRLADLADEES